MDRIGPEEASSALDRFREDVRLFKKASRSTVYAHARPGDSTAHANYRQARKRLRVWEKETERLIGAETSE